MRMPVSSHPWEHSVMSNVWIFAGLEDEIVPLCSLMYTYLVGKDERPSLSL